jgi:large subunit ribosomal protein L29
MSRKKNTELRERSVGDLTQQTAELQRDLWKTRFSNYTNQLDDTAKIKRLRRDIARTKTIITQKQAEEQKKAKS